MRLIVCMIREISRMPNRCAVEHYPTFPVNQRYFLSPDQAALSDANHPARVLVVL